MSNITFLEKKQVFGENRLKIFDLYGTMAYITDFAILLGDKAINKVLWHVQSGYCAGEWWTKTPYYSNAIIVDTNGNYYAYDGRRRYIGGRPAFTYSSVFPSNGGVRIRDDKVNQIFEINYGEYPQMAVSKNFSKTLENAYLNGTLTETGKIYITDSVECEDKDADFQEHEHIEYEYKGEKFIRFVANHYIIPGCYASYGELSSGRIIHEGDVVWIKVEPIKWIVDLENDIALSEKILFSGVQFKRERYYDGNFENTRMKIFIDSCFSQSIIPSKNSTNCFDNVKIKIRLHQTRK